jgi:nitroimidazol reductase NimA-like FMN-containing flavoprotein (pyridoxamine 5'-phosphate oxidase superfamily)
VSGGSEVRYDGTNAAVPEVRPHEQEDTMSGNDARTAREQVSDRFDHLSPTECWALLEGKAVGRVAYCKVNGPVVLPVNYTVRDQSIVFRTAGGSLLHDAMNTAQAAFQVDDIDDFLQAGWSVLLVGRAQWVSDTDSLTDLWWDRHQPPPWADGERNAFVRLVPTEITGRRVHPS